MRDRAMKLSEQATLARSVLENAITLQYGEYSVGLIKEETGFFYGVDDMDTVEKLMEHANAE